MVDEVLKDLKQFMFYDRPPQLNIPVEHRTTFVPVVAVKQTHPPPSTQPNSTQPSSTPPPIPTPLLKEKATNNGVFIPHQKDTLF